MRNIIPELFLFWGSVALSSLLIILSPYNPSLDGPAHLYNAQLINYLLRGNHFISEYFSLNTIPVPNLLDHVLLALLNIIFPVLISQKILLLFCTIGLCIAFRKLIKLYNPSNIGLSAFAIPLSHSFLYYLGFYNFCLSIVFLLWALYYYVKHFSVIQTSYEAKKIVTLSILILGNYFASALPFMFLGLLFLLHDLWLISPLVKSGQLKQNKSIIIKRLFFFILLWIPGIVLFIVFLLNVSFTRQEGTLRSFTELAGWVCNARPFEVYNDSELVITRIFSLILLFVLCGTAWLRVKRTSIAENNKKNIFLAAAVFSLMCFIVIPDSFSVGMMNIRLCFYFFLFFILWLAFQQNLRVIIWVATIAVYLLYWTLFFKGQYEIIQHYDARIEQMVEASDKYIKPNIVVLPVNCTKDWIMPHMADYISIHRPMVNLMDYELRDNWFPVSFNKSMPNMYGIYQNKIGYVNMFTATAKDGKRIDYIFIFGGFDPATDINAPDFSDLKENLQNRYTLIFTAEDKWIHIYKNNIYK